MRDTFLAMRAPDRDHVVKSTTADDPARLTAEAAGEKGWQHASPEQPGVMVHHDLPGHMLHVGDDGKWSHIGPGAQGGSRMHEAGVTHADLKRHLKVLHSGFSKLRKQRPPGPKTIEIDEDQDSIACVSESDDPASSFRVGSTYPDLAESEPLFSPVGKGNKYRQTTGLYAAKGTANFGGKKAPLFQSTENFGGKKAPLFRATQDDPRIAD